MSIENKQKEKVSDRYYYTLAIRVAVDFGASIAIPALLAAYAGQKLDEKFGTGSKIMFVLLALAFIITIISLVKKAKYYGKLYQREDTE